MCVCVQGSLKGNVGTAIKAPLRPPSTVQVTDCREQHARRNGWQTKGKRVRSLLVTFADFKVTTKQGSMNLDRGKFKI